MMPLYALILFFAGFAAILQLPGLTSEDVHLALFRLSIQTFDPWFVGVIGAAGLLTALVPGSLMLMSMSTLIAKNICQEVSPSLDNESVMLIARWLVPVVGLATVWFTLYGTNTIAALLIIGSSFITQQITPPVLFSLSPGIVVM